MSRTKTRIAALAALFALAVLALEGSARAASISSTIPVTGPFSASLNGSGTANITSLHGTLSQWLVFTHTNINFSATNQTSTLSIPTVNINDTSNGNVNMTYDNLTPGTPQTINAVNVDLTGGSTTPFTINATPITVSTSVGNVQLQLTVAGVLNDLRYDSSGAATVNAGSFISPGNFTGIISGAVNGAVVLPLGLGTLSLGQLTTISPTSVTFSAGIPGLATTTDLTPLNPVFPHSMSANFAAAINLTIPLPISFPLALNQNFPAPGSGKSGLTHIDAAGSIAATINLINPSYNLTGTVANVLVPEPSSLVMGSLALLGLTFFARRRKAA